MVYIQLYEMIYAESIRYLFFHSFNDIMFNQTFNYNGLEIKVILEFDDNYVMII